MCGRFTIQYTWAEYYEALNLIPASAKGRNDPPRHNVCPTQSIGMVCTDNDDIVVKDARWGLVPHWAKDLKVKPMINARSETVAEKPMFKSSFATRRCLIPANSFYEWDRKTDPDTPLPYNIHLKGDEPFFFAGIWRYHKHLDVTSCAILTTAPHDNIAFVHDRMPVILNAETWETWVSPKTETDEALTLISQNRGADLTAYRVGTAVNKNTAQGAELIEPI